MGLFKSKSLLLTGCLLAVSFTIINCQKAPNRSGTKANVTAPAATPADADGKATTDTVAKIQCEPEILKALKFLRDNKKIQSEKSEGQSEANKNTLITKRIEFLNNCRVIKTELEKIDTKACLENKGLVSIKPDEINRNKIEMAEFTNPCSQIKSHLKTQDNRDHDYEAPKVDPAVVNPNPPKDTQAKKIKEAYDAFQNANLQLSNEMKELTSVQTQLFASFIHKGQIKSGVREAIKLANANEVVCSFGASTTPIDKEKSFVVNITKDTVATRGNKDTDLGQIGDEFKGDAVSLLLTRVNDLSEAKMNDFASTVDYVQQVNLVCLNVKAESVNAAALQATMIKLWKDMSTEDMAKLKTANADRYKKAKADAAPTAAPAAAAPAVVLTEKQKTLAEVAQLKNELAVQQNKVNGIKTDLLAAKGTVEKFQIENKALLDTKDGGTIRDEIKKINAEVNAAQAQIDAAKAKNDTSAAEAASKVLLAAQEKAKALKRLEKYKDIDLVKVHDAYEGLTVATTKGDVLTASLTNEQQKLTAATAALVKAKLAAKAATATDKEIEDAVTAPAASAASTLGAK